MSLIVQSIQKRGGCILPSRSGSLPLSQPDASSVDQPNQLRRRLYSLSLEFPAAPNYISSTSSQYSSAAYSWALHRSKSLSSMGESAGSSLKKWWDRGWSWILSRKPSFAKDLEMNEGEIKSIGSHNKGSWRHVFYKLRAELRRILGSDNNVSLPTTCKRYDYSKNYAKSFDNGAFFTRSATVR